MRVFTNNLPQPARNYLSSITVVGLLIAVYSYTRVILETNGQWLYLALLTAVAAFLPVRLRFSGDQILSVIMGYSEVLKDSLWESSEARGDAQTILDLVDRSQGLTHKLLTFSRHQVLQPATLEYEQGRSRFFAASASDHSSQYQN